MIHADFEGRGLVTEAARVCERLGMHRELDACSDYWMKGQWTPSYRYAMLADEWSAHRPRG